jgi:hypothetical protein
MSLDDILYDLGRERLEIQVPILFSGLDIWILEVKSSLVVKNIRLSLLSRTD